MKRPVDEAELLEAIAEANVRAVTANQEVFDAVRAARRGRVTWARIGETLNISPQGAYQRFTGCAQPRKRGRPTNAQRQTG